VLETRPPAGDSADTARGVATARGTDAAPGRRQRLIAIGVPLVLWVVVSAAGWFRLTAQVRNTVWAEDGKVFLEEQFDMGVVGALFHDYAGYLHVVPRLVVAVASHAAPIDRFAVTVSVLCVLVTGAIGAAVYVLTAGVLDSVVARVLLAFVPALVPLGPMEIQGNVANLHWFLMFLVPFALLTPVRSWTKGILLGVATLLAGLTEIQVVAFFPLFLLGLRNRHRWPVIAGTAVGGMAQVVTTLMHPRAPASVPHDTVADMALGYVVQPVAGSVTWSMPTVGRLIAEHGLGVVLVPFTVALLVVLAGLWFGIARQRWVLASMLWGSAVVWFGAVWFNPNEMLAFAHFDDDEWLGVWTFRYSAAASIYVVAAFVVVVDVALRRARTAGSRPGRVLATVAAALVALAIVTTFVTNYQMDKANRQGGPFWDQQVDSSESACTREPTGDATVEIAPGPQWATTVPCTVIDRNGSR
jgi:hypothetical protein